jgi:hypothetical protein
LDARPIDSLRGRMRAVIERIAAYNDTADLWVERELTDNFE